MRRKDGEPRQDYDFELDDLILDVIIEQKLTNAHRIRKALNKEYSRKLGWNTIKRHLDRLLEQKQIKIVYQSEEGKRVVKIYKISNSSNIITITDK